MSFTKSYNRVHAVANSPAFVPSLLHRCNYRRVNNVIMEYPDHYSAFIYKEPMIYVQSDVRSKRKKELLNPDNFTPALSSIRRSKRLIRDSVLCNDFELFCTFTFDKNKVDRYSFTECQSYISRWLHHRKTFDPDLKYLFIPEFHKDGAIHFHALLSHFTGSMKSSHRFDAGGRPIFNITCFRAGFSTAIPIDNKEAVSNYVQKYITKSFVRRFNCRRFYCSRNLIRPIKHVNSNIFKLTPPLLRQKVSDYGDIEQFYLPK